VVEPTVEIREYPAKWSKPKIDLGELARLRHVEGWTVRRIQEHLGWSGTKIKDELRRMKKAEV
jgi:hypothetical protein